MRFKTKLILVTSLSLLVGVAITAVIALLSINNLGNLALKEIEKGLTSANEQYFKNYIQANATWLDSLLNNAVGDLQAIAEVAQSLEDNKTSLDQLNITALPALRDDLQFNPLGGWAQNPDNKAGVTSLVGPNLLDSSGKVKPEAEATLRQTALLKLFLPAIEKYGLDKVQVLYFGPPETPYVRAAPWSDYAADVSKAYPDSYHTKSFWDNYPALIQSWESQGANNPKALVKVVPTSQVATAKEPLVRLLYPIWDGDHKKVRGAVGLDLALDGIVKSIGDMRLASSGFAFLLQSDGEVLAVNDTGAKLMGLPTGVKVRNLKDSSVPDVAALQLPRQKDVILREIQINGQRHYVVLAGVDPLNTGSNSSQPAQSWSVGFIIPRLELLAAWFNTDKIINDNRQGVLIFTLLASLLSLLALLGVTLFLANRMTGSLTALAAGAKRIQHKQYDTEIKITTRDEFGQLAGAFNAMALEVKKYTTNLEDLVKERTAQLEQANQEITQLNERLKVENVRLKAELEITRQLQQMILPKKYELERIEGLDIAGFMEPADEVGGDYYDVLQQDGRVKIGIGDVTGHGLESGVLMIMVQTAVRTLLASNEPDAAKFLNVVNRAIYDNVQRMSSDKNLTLSLLDYRNGLLRLSGQHEEMIVVRGNGEVELIDTLDLGFPIGLEEDISPFVGQREVQLNPDDVVILYTDGITEAENPQGAQFGLDRLCEVVRANHEKTAQELKDIIIDEVRKFIGLQKVYDDITLLVIKQKALLTSSNN